MFILAVGCFQRKKMRLYYLRYFFFIIKHTRTFLNLFLLLSNILQVKVEGRYTVHTVYRPSFTKVVNDTFTPGTGAEYTALFVGDGDGADRKRTSR